jgi:hypothetical protein
MVAIETPPASTIVQAPTFIENPMSINDFCVHLALSPPPQ